LSRNSDRIGGATQNQDTAPPQQVAQNNETNDFSFIVPTELVDLPSRGLFYPDGHPLKDNESIEIKQMTAKEEDMLTSRSLLKKGVALDRVMQSIIVDKSIDPESILVGDRNAILIATRISAYGSDYNTKVTCPACGTTQEYSFNLNKVGITDAGSFQKIPEEVSLTDDGTFVTTLPKTGLNVEFRLLTGNDESQQVKGIEMDRKSRGQHEKNVTRLLSNIIVSVNGNTTAQAINYVVQNIPSIDARHLRTIYRVVNPNIDMTQYFECSNCDHEQDMEVPLTADFFWPDR
tara:strand:+ start:50 stop:919 length:870 start_codon:yes stop_codon:yes gene_type:complete